MIYICIPVHNRVSYTISCIDSIIKQTYKDYDIVVCDDGSLDNTYEILKNKYPKLTILKGDGNLWWTGSTNLCVKHVLERACDTDFIYTLNNDTELYSDTLENLVQTSVSNPLSIVGSVNLFFSNASMIEPSAFLFKCGFLRPLNKWGDDIEKFKGQLIKVSSLSGKGVLIPIQIFRSIGLYEQFYLPHYHSDTEFTIRAFRAGYSLYIDYNSRLKSHQNLSGIGSRTSKPVLKEFIRSFFIIKSPHHIKSLKAWNKLVYPKASRLYLYISIIGIILGFVKRSMFRK